MTKTPRQPLLSILIPTLRRPRCAEAVIKEFARQAGVVSHAVEIIVGENAATGALDDVAKLLGHTAAITHHKHRTKIPIGLNLLSLISMAQGDYLLIFGDDDAPRADLLPILVEHLIANTPVLTRLPHQYMETNEVLKPLPAPPLGAAGKARFTGLSDTVLADFEEKSGFISSHVFSTSHLRTVIEQILSCRHSESLKTNVYITKLYTNLVLASAGGYWVWDEVLVGQRIPSGAERNFFSNPVETYETKVLSPAKCYAACEELNPPLARKLMRIHFSKATTREAFSNSELGYFRVAKYFLGLLPKLGVRGFLQVVKVLCSRTAAE